ncbi:MAG TPA: DUF1015 domain-containing protein [Gemmatimonadales bacterium]|nr:DUF1015 domain-containing protein [Gemmatimonadales bacterium]
MNAELPPLVAPFRGERYAATELSALIAPPYDVISGEDRTRYAARASHNIVHLILPEAPSGVGRGGVGGGDRYAHAATLLAAWREAGVIRPDPTESVYIVAQDYAVPSGERRTRIGMVAAVRAEPFETRRVRPHEQTHSAPKADRLALLRATAANLESIFLLAPDPDRMLAQALVKRASGVPTARAELDGVAIRLWVVSGDQAADLARLAGRAQLYIADGHHRYETAVAYAREQPGADRVLSFIVSAGDPGLTILPTHRIIFGAGREPTKLVAAWREWFEVGRVAPCMDRVQRLAELGRERTACIVAFPDAYDVTLVLKNAAALDSVPDLGKTAAVRALDVARIESLVVQRILGAGTATPSLAYTPDPHAAFDAVRNGRAAAAVLLNPTKVRDVFAVADAGDVMPPKSTYFVPKVPSGLVVRAV